MAINTIHTFSTAHGGTIPAGVPGAVIITKNTSVLGSGAEGEPAVYNLQWVKEEQIIRNSKIEKVVTLSQLMPVISPMVKK